MIEMQFISRATLDTLSTIALPDSKFDYCRDNSPTHWSRYTRTSKIFLAFDSDELDLKTSRVSSCSLHESTR
jgi:hypothetical protein